ncbi:MAG TPA: DegT/DnrJ/EryC1/StrS family aminotransferase [Paracoccaceae bacterium]|nr:DegT/DnrJ/EryC1/StrS family aminotransferase [Paracoccaceae bacterium]HMO70071.1 DegT/DnrJ/EryC1/StrS family aminotransferase [Paracoccaceae bacterium]
MDRPSPIFVTRPVLPPLDDLLPLLDEIWQSRILTNRGPMVERLEAALGAHLGVEHVSLVANASLGLVLALRHLGITGEVVTTPFSFAASGHAIRWAGAEPVFADIDPATLGLDPAAAAARITPRTRAILAVHCYGIPCDTAGLAALAAAHGIPVIYDAAHAFGITTPAGPLCAAGELSVLSLHATKVFNTFEGGAVIARDRAAKEAIDRLANFGILDETSIPDTGLNGKMSELHAAVGLALLPHIGAAIAARAERARAYDAALRGIAGLRPLKVPAGILYNHYAYPVFVGPDYPLDRDGLWARLRGAGILARRYFHPLLSDLPMYRGLPSAAPGGLPAARAAAAAVLCLPLYPDLAPEEQARITAILQDP